MTGNMTKEICLNRISMCENLAQVFDTLENFNFELISKNDLSKKTFEFLLRNDENELIEMFYTKRHHKGFISLSYDITCNEYLNDKGMIEQAIGCLEAL